MNSEESQLLLLQNLLNRLDADASMENPAFRGIVSDAERNALRWLLEDLGGLPPPPLPPPPPDPERILNTESLSLDKPQEPRWSLCLDFGTAKSKAFAAIDDGSKLLPLAIGDADRDLDGSVHEVSSSIWVDDDGQVFVGSEAVNRRMRYSDLSSGNRRRLDSLKQEISQVRSQDGATRLERKLESDIDPTSTLTYSDVITFYLAYLTDLATTELESKVGVRYVRRRFTVPWWGLEQRRWAGKWLNTSLMKAQLLADTFRGEWRDGIHVGRIKKALDEAEDCAGRLEWMLADDSVNGVLEALAAASARVRYHLGSRELMLVVDVGAGTTDVSLFFVFQAGSHKAAPVKPGGMAIRQAGDTLDALLVDQIMKKAGLGEDRALRKRVSEGLYRGSVRRLKERLFETGSITQNLVSDHTVTLYKEEFIKSDGVRRFGNQMAREIQKFLNGIDATWGTAVRDHGLTLVLTGGGCRLPMVRGLKDKYWKIGNQIVRCRLAPDVPNFGNREFSKEFIREYPRLAVAMGGALKERLSENQMYTIWAGGARPPIVKRFV